MVNGAQYINPSKFPPYDTLKPQTGQGPEYHGYPNQGSSPWQTPHWHGDDKVNPHLRVLVHEPDGFRVYHDPVTGTYSKEHPSGEHEASTRDGHIHDVPGKRREFTGAGGHSEALGGNHDYTGRGHQRNNVTGDQYTNIQGSSHTFTAGHAVSATMGHSTQEIYGQSKTRLIGEKATWGVGVGRGDDLHDNMVGMTNKRIAFRARTDSDMWLNTEKKNLNISSGDQANVSSKSDSNMYAGGTYNIHGETKVIVNAKNGDVYIKPAGKVWIQGDMNISGTLYVDVIDFASSTQVADIGPTGTPT